MFGIGMPELLVIFVVAIVVIGPKRLPDLARSLGKAMGEFKKATNELRRAVDVDGDIQEVKSAINNIKNDDWTNADSAPAPPAVAADQAPAAPQEPPETEASIKNDDQQSPGPEEKEAEST